LGGRGKPHVSRRKRKSSERNLSKKKKSEERGFSKLSNTHREKD